MDVIWAVLSTLALYIGLLNSVFSRFVGTCTQGDANHLGGVTLSIPFFLLFLAGLWQTKYPRATFISCLPALFLLLWQSAFAARFLTATQIYGLSACQVLMGTAYDPDGHEPLFAILWSLVMFATLAATAVIVFKRIFHKSTRGGTAG